MKNIYKISFIVLTVLVGITLNPDFSSATTYTINVTMSGLQEVPPNASTATGSVTGSYDDVTNELMFTITFSGLSAPTTASHYHGPALPGVNAGVLINFGPAGFPIGVTSGSHSDTLILTAGQETQLLDGLWYANIHTSSLPGGELRGQMDQGTLPVELASLSSLISGNNVTLNWSTASEVNNSGFEIQRSISSSNDWTVAGFVAGRINSSTPSKYTYTDRNIAVGSYNYRLKQIDVNGNFEYFNLQNEVIVGIPSEFRLAQNYPNPFNPVTKIMFDIPVSGNVTLKVFDINGREVLTLVNETKNAGYYSTDFNAANVSSGIYYYTINANGFSSTKKMMVIK